MAQFITLTLTSSGSKFSINADQIQHIVSGIDVEGKPYNIVKAVGDEGTYDVCQTSEEILALIEGRDLDDLIPRQDAPRDPIVLSIRLRELASDARTCEPFVFEINGKPYLHGSLQECMESRHSYAVGCDQNQVPYTITDLPEPYKSDLADFHANPVIGGGLTFKEGLEIIANRSGFSIPESEEEVENPNFIPEDAPKPWPGDPIKKVSVIDPDWTLEATEYTLERGKVNVKNYETRYKGEIAEGERIPLEVLKGAWLPLAPEPKTSGLQFSEITKKPGFYRSEVDSSRVAIVRENDVSFNQVSFPFNFSRDLFNGAWTVIAEDDVSRLGLEVVGR